MAKDEVRLAIVGCGGIAGAHLRGYKELKDKGVDGFRIIATCDPALERAEDFARKIAEVQKGNAPRAYDDVEKMLRAEDCLDGVDICAPHSHHHLTAIPCLEAGVHILCEKPIGITVRATKAIIDAAKRNKRIAATAEQCRRTPGQRAVHWAINTEKLIGEPRVWYALCGSYAQHDPESPWHWRADRFLGGCGLVMDSGAHWCDTVRYFFGDVESVYAQVKRIESRKLKRGDEYVEDVREDTWMSILNFKSGVIGTWSFTLTAPGKNFLVVDFYGSEGCIEDQGDVFHPFVFQEKGAVHRKDGTSYTISELKKMYMESLSKEERERLFPKGIADGFALEVHDFIRAIAEGGSPEIGAEEGLKSKAIAEAIYESSCCGQAVKVQDVIDGKIECFQRDLNEHWKL